jgi:predicted helicase
MSIANYLEKLNHYYQLGFATEHTYRGDFAKLIEELIPDVDITNEPKKITDCGSPDYVLTKNKIPIGFIEAKDIDKDLNSKLYKDQFGRYKKALDNLIITDYIKFQFFQRGELIHEIRIAEIDGNKIKAIPHKFDEFTNLIVDFSIFVAQTIKSPKTLAQMMAAKARLLENILENAITSDEKKSENTDLKNQYETFKSILIHDLTPQGFADIYAQTLAYGMFAARLHDKSLDTFSRQEAAMLIPKSNPFLRKLFNHVAGNDIDERIVTTVDNLADVFRATNVEELLKNFGKSTQTQDPIIHFYETFLAEYDPKLRKARGVWYTPEPVVNFIVRGVDELLKREFSLKDGLADNSKIKIEIESQGTAVAKGKNKGKRLTEFRDVHKVQVLDPATGTGTFLSEVVKFIYSHKFKSMQGAWNSYVEEHLIPRLNGFELLMASYSMAHLKLDMLLSETGYQTKNNQRFNIFLTNSLEEHNPDTGTLFSSWLSAEANEANYVKRDTPVMVIMGNPPYSGESANKGEWIMELMEDYKKEPGGVDKLKERNPKWINDDYVKFLRYGQYFIEKNGEGILAFINPHGFLDNPTFRGMRWNLLKTYDSIYTIDLHGNAKKKEVSPDGTPDINVFDIEQGVSINFFIKTGKKKKNELAVHHHYEIYGERNKKYDFLRSNNLNDIPFEILGNIAPMYFMVKKDYKQQDEFQKGFGLDEIFKINSVGVVTARDKFTIHDSIESVRTTIDDFIFLDDEVARNKFNLGTDVRDWKISLAKKDILESGNSSENIVPINYRPFDIRYTYFTGKSKGFHCMPRGNVMRQYIGGDNIGLLTTKSFKDSSFRHVMVTKNISEAIYLSGTTASNAINFPLYIYSNISKERFLNLDSDILEKIKKSINLSFILDGDNNDTNEKSFSEIDLFDYIYSILHSYKYRDKFNDLLKTSYPKIPYPKDSQSFKKFYKLGSKLRKLHLLETENIVDFISSYPIAGSNFINRKINSSDWEIYDIEKNIGRIWINEEQYFEGVPLEVWEFYIGGYQPAKKWLKDRQGRVLGFNDIDHYQNIIFSLNETVRIMKEISDIDF